MKIIHLQIFYLNFVTLVIGGELNKGVITHMQHLVILMAKVEL